MTTERLKYQIRKRSVSQSEIHIDDFMDLLTEFIKDCKNENQVVIRSHTFDIVEYELESIEDCVERVRKGEEHKAKVQATKDRQWKNQQRKFARARRKGAKI